MAMVVHKAEGNPIELLVPSQAIAVRITAAKYLLGGSCRHTAHSEVWPWRLLGGSKNLLGMEIWWRFFGDLFLAGIESANFRVDVYLEEHGRSFSRGKGTSSNPKPSGKRLHNYGKIHHAI